MKYVKPFLNGREAEYWHNRNCAVCSTKCHFKKNMEYGVIIGEITIATAEFIGYTQKEGNHIEIKDCKNKDNYQKKKKNTENKNGLTLF